MTDKPLVLLTGASGYVGGKLLTRLERDGVRTRCLVRDPANFHRPVGATTEVVAGDAMKRSSLDAAMQGVTHAYYLIHSMEGDESFENADREAATNFGAAAREAGVQRIIYLGGLGAKGADLSPHLRSRHEVGDILRESGVPVLEFRAAVVIGRGSISYEMIRALVNRLPVMITPKWVSVPTQPIAVTDLLQYLSAALNIPMDASTNYEIGGADQVTYGEIMRSYARLRGLSRMMVPVPVLTPGLSSLWLEFITPVQAKVGRKLIESIENPTVVTDTRALHDFDVKPVTMEQALRDAIAEEESASDRTP
ncbi:MAG: NAD(P)H-binding protein [Gemmatimonadaceae bacterium]|nr:NAD(P)H-binding protein [Gemmatimonadaceae bacterium]